MILEIMINVWNYQILIFLFQFLQNLMTIMHFMSGPASQVILINKT